MLERFGMNKPSIYDEPIAKIVTSMNVYDPVDPEYKRMVKYLERLEKLKAGQRREPIKLDTIVTTAGTLMGILIIVSYEHYQPMMSKALGFVHKPRI